MKATRLQDHPAVHLLVFEVGDDALEGLKTYAEHAQIQSASFSGLGALSRAEYAFYHPQTRDYEYLKMNEQVEVLALVGNIGRKQGEVKIHPHITLGRRDGSVVGGHLMGGTVKPTLEVTITETPGVIRRSLDDASQLDLIDTTEGFTDIPIPAKG